MASFVSNFLGKLSSSSSPSLPSSAAKLSSPPMKLVIGLVFLFISSVAGNGSMTDPSPRIPPGDVENGLVLTRGPTSSSYTCGAGGNPGKVLTHYTAGQFINVKWEIGTANEGTCFIDLSTTGQDTGFQTLGSIPDCANKGETQYKTKFQLPSDLECDHCTLRFRWIPKLTGHSHVNCADVSITAASPSSNDPTPHQQRRKRNNAKAKAEKRSPEILYTDVDGLFAKRDSSSVTEDEPVDKRNMCWGCGKRDSIPVEKRDFISVDKRNMCWGCGKRDSIPVEKRD